MGAVWNWCLSTELGVVSAKRFLVLSSLSLIFHCFATIWGKLNLKWWSRRTS